METLFWRYRTVLVFLVLCFMSATGVAAGQSGKQNIESIYQRSSDGNIAIVGAGGVWLNPDACDSSSQIVIAGNNPIRRDLHAAILAAQMANREISAYISGCFTWNNITYPQVIGLYTF